jgi:hypothetical protein
LKKILFNVIFVYAHLVAAKRSGMGLIAHVKQPPEHKDQLHESYLKIPPEVFIRRKMGANVFMDAGELARAQWFWERRPKKLLLSTEAVLKILIFYGGLWVAAIWLNQHALEMTVLGSTGFTLVVAVPVWAFIDAWRLARWSSDYRRAILRLRQTVHR